MSRFDMAQQDIEALFSDKDAIPDSFFRWRDEADQEKVAGIFLEAFGAAIRTQADSWDAKEVSEHIVSILQGDVIPATNEIFRRGITDIWSGLFDFCMESVHRDADNVWDAMLVCRVMSDFTEEPYDDDFQRTLCEYLLSYPEEWQKKLCIALLGFDMENVRRLPLEVLEAGAYEEFLSARDAFSVTQTPSTGDGLTSSVLYRTFDALTDPEKERVAGFFRLSGEACAEYCREKSVLFDESVRAYPGLKRRLVRKMVSEMSPHVMFLVNTVRNGGFSRLPPFLESYVRKLVGISGNPNEGMDTVIFFEDSSIPLKPCGFFFYGDDICGSYSPVESFIRIESVARMLVNLTSSERLLAVNGFMDAASKMEDLSKAQFNELLFDAVRVIAWDMTRKGLHSELPHGQHFIRGLSRSEIMRIVMDYRFATDGRACPQPVFDFMVNVPSNETFKLPRTCPNGHDGRWLEISADTGLTIGEGRWVIRQEGLVVFFNASDLDRIYFCNDEEYPAEAGTRDDYPDAIKKCGRAIITMNYLDARIAVMSLSLKRGDGVLPLPVLLDGREGNGIRAFHKAFPDCKLFMLCHKEGHAAEFAEAAVASDVGATALHPTFPKSLSGDDRSCTFYARTALANGLEASLSEIKDVFLSYPS